MAAREIVLISGTAARIDFDRFVAAIDHDLRAALGGERVQHGRQLLAFGRIAALYVDQQPRLSGKVASTSPSVGIRPMPLPRNGKVLPPSAV